MDDRLLQDLLGNAALKARVTQSAIRRERKRLERARAQVTKEWIEGIYAAERLHPREALKLDESDDFKTPAQINAIKRAYIAATLHSDPDKGHALMTKKHINAALGRFEELEVYDGCWGFVPCDTWEALLGDAE